MKRVLILLLLLVPALAYSQRMIRKNMPDRLVVLTFDGVSKSQYTAAAPLLRQYGFTATFYVQMTAATLADTSRYLSWSQVKQLAGQGFEIGNQTNQSRHLNELNTQQLTDALKGIEKKVDSLKMDSPESFAYPGNDPYQPAQATLQAMGYKTARLAENRLYDPKSDNPFFIPSFEVSSANKRLIISALERTAHEKIAVLTFHGIPDPARPWLSTTPADFEYYLKYLSDNNYTVIAMRDLDKYLYLNKAAELPAPPPLRRD